MVSQAKNGKNHGSLSSFKFELDIKRGKREEEVRSRVTVRFFQKKQVKSRTLAKLSV